MRPPQDSGSGADEGRQPGLVVVLSFSTTARDPRVARQCKALLDDGWRVTSVGFGAMDATEQWTHRTVLDLPYETRPDLRAKRIADLLAVRLAPRRALTLWHAESRHKALVDAATTLDKADLVIANDFVTLPVGIDLAKRLGAGLLYDTHEYAAVERVEDARWRLLYPPYVRALEREAEAAGATWMTVSDGIAAALARDYGLAETPIVVRNMPTYVSQPFRDVGSPTLVHYHGALTPGRGLETVLDSVPHWHDGLRLRIRGPGDDRYRAALAGRVAALGVQGKVVIEPGLPLDGIIAGANDADIGIHLLPPYGDQNRFALPNKLFEYLMAGLAVVISDLSEMGEIVRSRDVGQCLSDTSPRAIAAALNGLSRAQIARWKANALSAARDLCWDRERRIFQAACRKAAGGRFDLRPRLH